MVFVIIAVLLTSCNSNTEGISVEIADKIKAPSYEVIAINEEVYSLENSLRESRPTLIYFTASWYPTCEKTGLFYPSYPRNIRIGSILLLSGLTQMMRR